MKRIPKLSKRTIRWLLLSLAALAFIFTILALSMSLWTRKYRALTQGISKSRPMVQDKATGRPLAVGFVEDVISYGVWGYCVTGRTTPLNSAGLDIQVSNCIHYYSTDTTTRWYIDTERSVLSIATVTGSACSLYNSFTVFPNQAHPLEFNSYGDQLFMNRACGSLGRATLAMSILAMAFSIPAFFLLLLTILAGRMAHLMKYAEWLSFFTSLLSLITVILWSIQSGPLFGKYQRSRYQVSFYFEIFSFIFFLLSALLLWLEYFRTTEGLPRTTESGDTSTPGTARSPEGHYTPVR